MTKRHAQLVSHVRPLATLVGAVALACVGAVTLGAQDDPFGSGAPAASPAVPTPKPSPGRNLPIPDDPAVQEILSSKPDSPAQFTRAVRNLLNLGYPDHALTYLEGLERLNPTPEDWLALHAAYGTDFFLRLAREPALQPAGNRVSRAALAAVQKLSQDPNRIAQLIGQLNSDDQGARRAAVLALKQVGVPAIPALVAVLADEARAPLHHRVQLALLELGELAIEPLIGALESPQAALRLRAIEALGALKAPRALGYLVRLGQQDEENVQLQRAARDALFLIVDAVPDRRDAGHFLRRRVGDLIAGSVPVRLDAENQAVLWHWDAATGTVVPRRYSHRQLCMVEAARLARELYILEPGSIDNRRLYLAADLEAAKTVTGLDQPLPRGAGSALERAVAMGGEAIEDLLVEMMRGQRVTAAACAAEVLGELGTDEYVRGSGGAPRPLVLALNQADRRLRFAALQAIVKLDPQEPFAGSNYVGESLSFLGGSVASRRALVAHHRLDEARTLAGLLAELGYDADTATTSRGVFLQAARQPDYEFVLVSDTLSGPPVKELLPQLRQDKRTAGLAVGVLVNLQAPAASPTAPRDAPAEGDAAAGTGQVNASSDAADKSNAADKSTRSADEPRRKPIFAAEVVRRGSSYYDHTSAPADPLLMARRWTFDDQRSEAYPRPYDLDGMDYVVRNLRASAARSALSREERVAQAQFALGCLAKFAADEPRYGFYEVLRFQAAAESALRTPELTVAAARALGAIGSPRAQLALVDLASQFGRPLEDRQVAVAAFREAVLRRSLRLTRTEIVRQYDRYNQSERQDEGTQKVLGAILDIIESVDAAATSPPTTPAAETSAPPPHGSTSR